MTQLVDCRTRLGETVVIAAYSKDLAGGSACVRPRSRFAVFTDTERPTTALATGERATSSRAALEPPGANPPVQPLRRHFGSEPAGNQAPPPPPPVDGLIWAPRRGGKPTSLVANDRPSSLRVSLIA